MTLHRPSTATSEVDSGATEAARTTQPRKRGFLAALPEPSLSLFNACTTTSTRSRTPPGLKGHKAPLGSRLPRGRLHLRRSAARDRLDGVSRNRVSALSPSRGGDLERVLNGREPVS